MRNTFILLALTFICGSANASIIQLNANFDTAQFQVYIQGNGDIQDFWMFTDYYGGPSPSPVKSELRILGELPGTPQSLVIEQEFTFAYDPDFTNYMDYPLPGDPFTPLQSLQVDFWTKYVSPFPDGGLEFYCEAGAQNSSTKVISAFACDLEPIPGSTFLQSDVLYAVVALGDGVQRANLASYDDPFKILPEFYPGGGDDLTLNIGMSFDDPSLQAGDPVSIIYRHFFGFGLDAVPIAFVPEPGTLSLFGVGLLGLVFAKRKRAASTSKLT